MTNPALHVLAVCSVHNKRISNSAIYK